MNHISKMMEGIESMDFLVVDGVLLSSVISSLVDTLLSSTFWFDISTGNTFISHSDDGLVHKSFHQIGKVSMISHFLSVLTTIIRIHLLIYFFLGI